MAFNVIPEQSLKVARDYSYLLSGNNLKSTMFHWYKSGLVENPTWSAEVEYEKDGCSFKREFNHPEFSEVVRLVGEFVKGNIA